MDQDYGLQQALRELCEDYERAEAERRRQARLACVKVVAFIVPPFAAIAMALVMMGCPAYGRPVKLLPHAVDTTPIALAIDEAMPGPLVFAAIKAAHYWQCALGADVFADRGKVGYRIASPGRLTYWGQYGSSWRLTLLRSRTDFKHRVMRTSDLMLSDDLDQLEHQFRHELGHILGLDDGPCPGLMCPSGIACPSPHPICGDGDTAADASEAQLAALRRLHGVQNPSYDVGLCHGHVLLMPWPYDWLVPALTAPQ